MVKPLNDFFYKVFHWEYWPFEVVYAPVFFYWLYLSFKARSLFFFTASNPSIDTGGMLGESKVSIYKLIPSNLLPNMLLMKPGEKVDQNRLEEAGLFFPLMVKPNIGERGTDVEKITNIIELENYAKRQKAEFFIQEYIDYPIELGVFYYRFPDSAYGQVSSVTIKEYLKVRGDGKSTLSELMEKYPRARFQLSRLLAKNPDLAKYIPQKDEEVVPEPIGNHCRGAAFFNGSEIVDEKFNRVFNDICLNIPGFHYGRFDLKCRSIENLKEGKNFKILELNGAGSEPSHIYHPGFSIIEGWKVLLSHWDVLYKISKQNHQRGIPYMSLKEGVLKWKALKRA